MQDKLDLRNVGDVARRAREVCVGARVAGRPRRSRSSRMEEAVTFFSLQRLVDMQDKLDFAERGDVARRARGRRQRLRSASSTPVPLIEDGGSCDLFLAATSSRYAEQIGSAERGDVARRARGRRQRLRSASSTPVPLIEDGGGCDLFLAATSSRYAEQVGSAERGGGRGASGARSASALA